MNGGYRESRANEPHWSDKPKLNKDYDPVVQSVIDQFSLRSRLGMKKYGVPLTRDDYSLRDWLHHAKEEAMDFVNYCEAAIQKIDRENKK